MFCFSLVVTVCFLSVVLQNWSAVHVLFVFHPAMDYHLHIISTILIDIIFDLGNSFGAVAFACTSNGTEYTRSVGKA
jgi:hypothetical protein